jgi:hypothetical protein
VEEEESQSKLWMEELEMKGAKTRESVFVFFAFNPCGLDLDLASLACSLSPSPIRHQEEEKSLPGCISFDLLAVWGVK